MNKDSNRLKYDSPPESIAPNPSCKYCYGRGYEGINSKTSGAVLCRCVVKKMDPRKTGRVGMRILPTLE